MNILIFWLLIALILVSPVIFYAGSIRNLFLGWRVHTTWISALPNDGWVEVLGRVRGEPVKSLLYGSECAYWQVEVQEYQNQGRGRGRWRTIHKQSSGSFMLDDMTGRIQVLDGKANMMTSHQMVTDNSDPDVLGFLQGLGIKTTGVFGLSKRQRIYERLVIPGEEILVLGKLQKSSMPVTIIGKDIAPLLVSNFSRSVLNKSLLSKALQQALVLYAGGFITMLAIYASTQGR